MKTSHIALVIILALIAGFGGATLAGRETPVAQQAQKVETAYERVMRTKTLRCGWFAEPPFTNYDVNTGERSGIVPDIINTFAADYDLKVEWETISNFALMGEDLKQGKYDAICASLINMPRGGLIDPVDAFVYVPMYGYVRANETRLTSLAQLDNKDYRIAVQEGAAVMTIAQKKFPQAQLHVIPSAELSEMFTSVVDNKADIAFMIPTFYQAFIKNNPGTLKPLNNDQPLQVFNFSFGVKPQEDGLKSLFNNTLRRMMISGDLAAIFAKHDPAGGLIYPTVSNSAPTINKDAAKTSANEAPPELYVDKDACPFEGCIYREWSVLKQTQLYDSIEGGKIVGTLKAGETVKAITGEVHTKPGKVQIVTDHENFKAGTFLYVLTYQGEGTYKILYNGKMDSDATVYEVLDANPKQGKWGKLIQKPESTWYVQMQLLDGTIGWTKETKNFGNNDRYG